MKHILTKLTYIFLPMIFIVIIHLLFSYGNWNINPNKWDSANRSLSAFMMFISIIVGILIAMNMKDFKQNKK